MISQCSQTIKDICGQSLQGMIEFVQQSEICMMWTASENCIGALQLKADQHGALSGSACADEHADNARYSHMHSQEYTKSDVTQPAKTISRQEHCYNMPGNKSSKSWFRIGSLSCGKQQTCMLSWKSTAATFRS